MGTTATDVDSAWEERQGYRGCRSQGSELMNVNVHFSLPEEAGAVCAWCTRGVDLGGSGEGPVLPALLTICMQVTPQSQCCCCRQCGTRLMPGLRVVAATWAQLGSDIICGRARGVVGGAGSGRYPHSFRPRALHRDQNRIGTPQSGDIIMTIFS